MAKAKGEDEIDALFHLPLAEFTAARNALAARLKKAGQTADADRIKSLPKPSIAAWVVNQLHFKHRAAFDRLIAAGEKFRNAQTAHLSGKSADIRTPLEARRAALSELSGHAAATLRQAGSTATPDMMRRVTTTLEALSTYAGLPDTPRAGRLTDDIEPPGFETLAALVPRLGKSGHGPGPTRVIPFQPPTRASASKKAQAKSAAKKASPEDDSRRAAEARKAQLAAAKAAMQQADRDLRDARKVAQRAEEALKKAAARAKDAEAAKKKAEEELEKAAADADAARKQARSVAAEAEEAAQSVEDAERALEAAHRALREAAE